MRVDMENSGNTRGVLLRWLDRLERLPDGWILGGAVLLVAVIGVLDFQLGYEFNLGVLYLIPLAVTTWVSGRTNGTAVAVLSVLANTLANNLAGRPHSHLFFYFWDAFVRLVFFIVVTYILSGLKKTLDHEKDLARTDFLTGAVNRRQFFSLVQAELERGRRYNRPFSLVYLDIDDFKDINDRFGHAEGDRVLQRLVTILREHLRTPDVVARLGGDEFGLILPETGEEEAETVIRKIRERLTRQLEEEGFPVTLSMGMVTCTENCPSLEDALRQADHLMYSEKQKGKNGFTHRRL
ncbi:MAG: diguanylate cyclase [Acidobacteriota bacterium]